MGSWLNCKERCHRLPFAHVKSGDAIGLLLDADRHVVMFTLNGQLQGACTVPDEAMYFTTALDRQGDCVELRRRLPAEFPYKLADVPSSKFVLIEGPRAHSEPGLSGRSSPSSRSSI